MASSNLSPTERQVLGGLMLGPDAKVEDRTVSAVASLTGLSEADVEKTLEGLEQLDPPLVHRDTDLGLDLEFWIALEAAIAAFEDA